eukprot:SAG11_NODE_32464_length_283_cov_0.913043_2_plen_43_part_01
MRFTSARTQHSNGGAERAIAVIEDDDNDEESRDRRVAAKLLAR